MHACGESLNSQWHVVALLVVNIVAFSVSVVLKNIHLAIAMSLGGAAVGEGERHPAVVIRVCVCLIDPHLSSSSVPVSSGRPAAEATIPPLRMAFSWRGWAATLPRARYVTLFFT